ncbi:hypothetical protein A0O28_0102850 [Trichoderma guizhouense]|uniref:Uncharacterized protein n=1 Tax=Trichoderma guizhouense TaxID=1491466 RepID=A0A1T3CL54_9HYPO|nr:hypothetical protein A0O28_0102850 [Trichoderma guizhouense]
MVRLIQTASQGVTGGSFGGAGDGDDGGDGSRGGQIGGGGGGDPYAVVSLPETEEHFVSSHPPSRPWGFVASTESREE